MRSVPENFFYSDVSSPVGDLLLVSNGAAFTGVLLPDHRGGSEPRPGWRRDDDVLRPAREQLRAYFAGGLLDFDLALAPQGTPFQRRVWDELRRIPFGVTISYAELARRVGQPTAARAVGAANGRNPIPIIVPCHRVIGANGTLTGYGGGLECKRLLLEHERIVLARRGTPRADPSGVLVSS
jgi:methylated-DNA-[protein]-cysteine S-methyltransferase